MLVWGSSSNRPAADRIPNPKHLNGITIETSILNPKTPNSGAGARPRPQSIAWGRRCSVSSIVSSMAPQTVGASSFLYQRDSTQDYDGIDSCSTRRGHLHSLCSARAAVPSYRAYGDRFGKVFCGIAVGFKVVPAAGCGPENVYSSSFPGRNPIPSTPRP